MPAGSKVLKERVADVRFPNYFGKFGWKAVGTRTDEIEGRATRTVFYEKGGAGSPTPSSRAPRSRSPTPPPGPPSRAPSSARCARKGLNVVTWRRRGHTCVLSSKDVPREELQTLAAWKGMGGVAF